MKNKVIRWVIYSPFGKAVIYLILKDFIKALKKLCDDNYGVKMSPQNMPISGGGPRHEYTRNFLDGNFDALIESFIDNDFKVK